MSVPSGHGDAIQVGNVRHTYDDLRSVSASIRSQLSVGETALLRTDDAALVAAAFFGLDGWAGAVHLLPAGIDADIAGTRITWPGQGQIQAGTDDGGAGSDSVTRWVLYTSGTTGVPKAIIHSFESLSRTVSRGANPSVWGLLYDPNRMAGIQVVLQSLLTGSRLVAPPTSDSLNDRVAAFVAGGVNALSATPTVWRRILQSPDAAELRLEQITLGGEIADQTVLDALRHRFPDARIVHVFASTETGAAFSVRDGRAGFPASYLSDPPRGIDLDVRDGILHVYSPGVSVAGADGFASTGDIVEVIDDRVLFRGRASGVVNVGGANVWPEEVEQLLRSHPAVADAVVTAKPNALVGNMLVASVVASPDADRSGLGKVLRAFVREHAPSTHVPASVKVVEELELSGTGKAVRA